MFDRVQNMSFNGEKALENSTLSKVNIANLFYATGLFRYPLKISRMFPGGIKRDQ